MALASSMKALVDDINTSTDERHAFIQGVVKVVQALKKDTQALMQRFKKEHDDLIVEIQADAKELHGFLAVSEKTRKEDFAAVMEEINNRLGEISKWQKSVRKDTQEFMKEFAADIKQARNYWLSLSGGVKGKGKQAPVSSKKRERD